MSQRSTSWIPPRRRTGTDEDWYYTYRFLRDEAPVYRMSGTDVYVLTRYDDVNYIMRNPGWVPNGFGDTNPPRAHEDARYIYDERG